MKDKTIIIVGLTIALVITNIVTYISAQKIGYVKGVAAVETHLESVKDKSKEVLDKTKEFINKEPIKIGKIDLDKAGEAFNKLLPKK